MIKIINKRYCEKCGKQMIAMEFSKGFDRYSGVDKKWVRYTCPELDWEQMLKNEQFNYFAETFMGHYYFSEKLD